MGSAKSGKSMMDIDGLPCGGQENADTKTRQEPRQKCQHKTGRDGPAIHTKE